ncbi:kinesin-like calmodulin-binding protein [Striga asiatica]|uniref:Kinesin-like calmodulin-binding protein n=1 Tax=Striga asiatica TaxID=4170 RepID=A0A5A7Q4A1_STRAF|nr:kinesin-like calmodulin-binding protein [Striga asiatica]
MDHYARMLRIAERYRVLGWSVNEERECYRLFFNLCRETLDVNVPTYFRELLTFLGSPGVNVHADSGRPGARFDDPIMFDDTNKEIVVGDRPNGADGADWVDGTDWAEYINGGANDVHEQVDHARVEEHDKEYMEDPV